MPPARFPLFRRKLAIEYRNPLLGTAPPSNPVYFRSLALFPKVVQHNFKFGFVAEWIFPHDWIITLACLAKGDDTSREACKQRD